MKAFLIIGCLLLTCQFTEAQTLATDPGDLEIDGLVIDNTRSKMGREFYEYFYQQWEPPLGINDYAIHIEEKPPRGNSATVEIKVNDLLVSIQRLEARGDAIETTAQMAIGQVLNYLLDNSRLQEDIKNSDQAGSGIF